MFGKGFPIQPLIGTSVILLLTNLYKSSACAVFQYR